MGIEAGEQFLARSAVTPDYDDYHRVVMQAIGITPSAVLLADLSRPLDPAKFVETFPEVVAVLAELRRRAVRMAVVSDAWPNLPEIHAAIGIRDFFEAYAISAVLGCCKPDTRMYGHGSGALGLAPAEGLFVDDDPEFVQTALDLGYHGRAAVRDDTIDPGSVPAIADLRTVA